MQGQDATDPQSLMQFATGAEENLVKLATGLAQHGAQSSTIAELHQMADVTRQIASQIGHAAVGATQAPENQLGAAGQQGQQQGQAPMSMDAATQHLHEAMQTSAALRQQPQGQPAPQGGPPPR